MTAKNERGAQAVGERNPSGLQSKTIAYAMLKRIAEHGTVKPAALHDLMPAGRRNTVTVMVYMSRLEKLCYAVVGDCDEISITRAGRAFIDDEQEEPSSKYSGMPAAPRVVNIWTKPMMGYDAAMRAGRRVA